MSDTKEKTLLSKWLDQKDRLEAIIYSKVKCHDTTKDILQNAFYKAYTHINALKNMEKVEAWLFRIAQNETNAYFNRLNKGTLLLTDLSIEETHLTEEFENCVDAFIDRLPKKYAEAVKLSDIEKIPQKDLAQKLNISYSGVKSRVQRGREKLKMLLLECCEIEHDVYGNIINTIPKKKYCPTNCN